MKKIETYWIRKEFDIKKGWFDEKHYVTLEVSDDATDEEIEDLAKRKDVIIIK